ncbi:MAG TPA: nucleotidyl transferase AbiEii/AbiGii toxin family protein [Solirubrobacterales bacterium]|nr:nucleotidyl transferase AbiEii/AbiGii toxin family protein [Solirubrobacterales bacterium]
MTGFGRILEELNQAGVRYVLIGGIALIRHGVVRATRDVDVVFDPDPDNVQRIEALVSQWGATRPDGSPVPKDSISGQRSIHLSTEMGDVDLVAEKTVRIPFSDLFARAGTKKVDGVEAPICSLADLVAMKRAAGRERDLADLSDLRAAHGELPEIE